VVMLSLGALVCAWQALQSNHRAISEREAKEREAAGREEAEAKAQTAKMDAAEARAVLRFLLLNVLRAESPHGDSMKDLAIRGALEQAETKVEAGIEDQPLIQATIHAVVAQSFQQLRAEDAAIKPLERAVELRRGCYGPGHPSTLRTMMLLGVAYQ